MLEVNDNTPSGDSYSGSSKPDMVNCAQHKINPATEDKYWSENYKDRDYINQSEGYETYRHAYRHGIE